MFYLLSFFTGILECGWIFRGHYLGLPLYIDLVFVVAYHLGNLFPLPFAMSRRTMYIIDFMVIALAGVSLCLAEKSIAALVLQGCGIFLCSALVQSVRSEMKSDGNRVMKRICRVAGFIAAPTALFVPNIILIIGAILGLAALWEIPETRAKFTRPGLQGGFSLVMLFHQLHYFFYAHITLALAVTIFGNPAAVLFALTWVTYLLVEPFLRRLGKPVPVFFLGHSLLAVLLIVLAFAELNGDVISFVVMWVAAGFGGGTVFAITDINKQSGCFEKNSETITENFGHILGTGTAAMCALAIGEQAPLALTITAAFSVICTIVTMFFVRRRAKCKSTQ